MISKIKYSRELSIKLLKNKRYELNAGGINRFPQRSDFTEEEVTAIKAFLGPWPRALEAAGIKPERGNDRLERNREKRIRAKRQRMQELIKQKKTAKSIDSLKLPENKANKSPK